MGAREVSEIALFVALAIASGFALLAVPNVELMTLSVFCAGVFLGARRGALVGSLAMLLFTTFNPYGAAPFPLAFAQVVTMAVVGLVGGWESRWITSRMASAGGERSLAGSVALAATGVLVTVLYDLVTTLAIAVVMAGTDLDARSEHAGASAGGLWSLVIAGSAFSVLHIVSNAVIFCVIGGPAIRAIHSWRSTRG